MAKKHMGSASPFYSKFRIWKGHKFRWIILLHIGLVIFHCPFGKSKSLALYDFGSNGNYPESLKALCVVSRMPAGAFWSPKKPTPTDLLGVSETSRNYKNKKTPHQILDHPTLHPTTSPQIPYSTKQHICDLHHMISPEMGPQALLGEGFAVAGAVAALR